MNRCPKCGETERQNKAGKTAAGAQRYRCMKCGRTYTAASPTKLAPPHNESHSLKPLLEIDHRLKKSFNQKELISATKFALLFLICVWLGSAGILSSSLIRQALHLRQMAADPALLNLTVVASEVHDVRQKVSILRGELAPVLWVSARLGGDPGAITSLVDAGNESLKAADEALSALTPSLGTLGLSSFSMEQVPHILDALADSQPALIHATAHLDTAASILTRIRGPLSKRVEGWVSKASQLVQLAQYGMGGAQIVPGVLGQTGQRTYLIMFQNSDELRPTGGFISAIGRVQISDGQLISMTAEDSYAIDDFTKIYPDPPQPLLDYMGSEQWLLRDANWSPDFPTTALDAIHLYQISRPDQLDGVIGLNLKGVGMLIAGVEPVEVPGFPEPVTSANVTRILQEAWNPLQDLSGSPAELDEWWINRKRFVDIILRAAMDKLLAGNANWKILGQGIIEALNQRQLMIYTLPEASEMKRLHWDGSLLSSTGDYLMVVDANVGFSKVNSFISESVNYQVTLFPDGTGRAVIELDYAHQGTGTDVICTQYRPYNIKNLSYDKLMQTCYYDYLRLVVPRGSQLLQATAHPTPGKYLLSGLSTDGKAVTLYDSLNNWTMFGQFFVVEYGKHLQTRLEYDLPVVVSDVGRQEKYSLLVQKQPGTDAMPVKVRLTLPAQARFISSNLVPATISGNTLEFDLHLAADQQLEIIYTPAP